MNKCPDCGIYFAKYFEIANSRKEETKDISLEKRLVKKYILYSFIYNWLWLFGIGNIVGIHYSFKALDLIKKSKNKLKGKTYAIFWLIFGVLMILFTLFFAGTIFGDRGNTF